MSNESERHAQLKKLVEDGTTTWGEAQGIVRAEEAGHEPPKTQGIDKPGTNGYDRPGPKRAA